MRYQARLEELRNATIYFIKKTLEEYDIIPKRYEILLKSGETVTAEPVVAEDDNGRTTLVFQTEDGEVIDPEDIVTDDLVFIAEDLLSDAEDFKILEGGEKI